MNESPTIDRVGGIAKVLCALSLAVACTPAWSDTGKANYEMAFFADSAQGSKILSGNYKKAIEKIAAKVHGHASLHAKTNLCVAYTKAGDIAAAEAACDAAVAAAKTFRKSGSGLAFETSSQMRARFTAIALSNRGVLKAVKGDLAAARADFDAALAQQAREIPLVRANLEKLESVEESA